MKTRIIKRIETETNDLNIGYWDMEDEEFVSLHSMNDDELNAAAKLIGLSPIGASMLIMFADDIREKVGSDLASIWERLDKAGIE